MFLIKSFAASGGQISSHGTMKNFFEQACEYVLNFTTTYTTMSFYKPPWKKMNGTFNTWSLIDVP